MGEAEDELARLRAENVRLRAMIDGLERAGGNKPAPLAAHTQIIKAGEAGESPEHSKKPRSKRKLSKEQKQISPFEGCLSALFIAGGITAAYIGLLILSARFSDNLQRMNFWSLLFGGLVFGPLILVSIGLVWFLIHDQREQRLRHAAQLQKRRQRSRRRITRKLHPAITQKLDTE